MIEKGIEEKEMSIKDVFMKSWSWVIEPKTDQMTNYIGSISTICI